MIVYNVKHRFFALKSDAEEFRKSLGLRPHETVKLTIRNRDELAEFLDGLCSLTPPGGEAETPEQGVAAAIKVPAEAVPDYVPKFLARSHGYDV